MKKIYFLLFCSLLSVGAHAQFIADLAGDPIDITGWTLSTEASVVDSTLVITQAIGNQASYVYYSTPENLTTCAQFTVDFDFRIQYTGSQVADGLAFWYISNPPTGFTSGNAIGLPSNPNGLLLIMDTYNNNGPPVNTPIATLLGYDGTENYVEDVTTGQLCPQLTNQSFITDQTWHHVNITYANGNISVYFDYSATAALSGNYPLNINGYFGFSASTGAVTSTQAVKNVHIVGNSTPPPPPVTDSVVYCQFDAAVPLTATGTTLTWYSSLPATNPLPGAPTPSTLLADTLTYYVTQGSGVCPSNPDSIKVYIKPQPVAPVISGDTAYCQNATFVPFNVTGQNVLWYAAATGGTGSGTASTITTGTAGNYVVYATQTVNSCESPRDSFEVVVHPTPAAPVITAQATYCQTEQFVPFTVTGQNVLWYTDAIGGTGSTSAPVINTATAATYTFYASQTIFGCEGPRASVNVTVNQIPVPPTIAGQATYCQNTTYVPVATTAGQNILWYTAATGGTGTATPMTVNTAIPGQYIIYATQTVNGCESPRASFLITVYPGVSVGFSYQIHYGCAQDTVIFTDTSKGQLFTHWDFGDSNIDTAVNPTHIYTQQGTYTVKLFVTNFNCSDSTSAVVSLVHPISSAFTLTPDTLCQGQTVTFTNASVGTNATYLWNFGDRTNDTATNTAHTYNVAGTYTVTLTTTDFVPCSATATALVYVDTISGIDFTLTDTVVCQGRELSFEGTYATLGNTGIKWDFGDGTTTTNTANPTHAYDISGVIPVTFSATYRVCPDTTITKQFTVRSYPLLNLGADTAMCPGSAPLKLYDSINYANPLAHWQWSTGDTTSAITINQPGYYAATVSVNGCSTSDSIWVKKDCYIDIPNVFTPNDDGVNDYFFPRQLLSSSLATFQVDIYNRWGQTIFESTSLNGRGWDGKFNDKPQPDGVYVYIMDLTYKDGRKEHYQGNVTLIR